jgi:hypothetical protein
MKSCPKCGQSYTDENINFCLNDGELLSRNSESQRSPFDTPPPHSATDDSPPTMILDQARVTNPIGWSNTPAAPPVPWQQQQPASIPFAGYVTPNQTLAIVSLCLGASSLVIGWCCSTGLLLGPAAIITGFIALSQIKKDPKNNGGRPLAIGGIAAGGLYVGIYAVIIVFYIITMLLGSIR